MKPEELIPTSTIPADEPEISDTELENISGGTWTFFGECPSGMTQVGCPTFP